MAKCVWIVYLIVSVLRFTRTSVSADDRIVFNEEDERRWNTPPELIPEPIGRSKTAPGGPQARFLPFSASFSLSAGANNAHSLSVGANNGGVSLSQSTSQADALGSFAGQGTGLSASQSTSFSAGLSGISASDANAFNLNHPIFGGTSQANSNSFSLGDATATSQGAANNGQASSGAQSGVGGTSSGATSGAGGGHSSANSDASAFDYQGHRQPRPIWTNVGPNTERDWNSPSWRPAQNQGPNFSQNKEQSLGCGGRRPSRVGNFRSANYYNPNNGCGNVATGQGIGGSPTGTWSNGGGNQQPSTQISAASASSGASSSGNGFSFGQSSSQSNSGPNGPSSSTNQNVQTSGNAQGFSQGAAAAIGQTNGQTEASFGSGTLVGNSQGNGQSFGTAISGNRGQNSKGQVNSQTFGNANVQGTANAGSVSFVRYPDESVQHIPTEFIRSHSTSRNEQNRRGKKKDRHPVDTIITEITDSVVDFFDI